jgi:hypothetical protein
MLINSSKRVIVLLSLILLNSCLTPVTDFTYYPEVMNPNDLIYKKGESFFDAFYMLSPPTTTGLGTGSTMYDARSGIYLKPFQDVSFLNYEYSA